MKNNINVKNSKGLKLSAVVEVPTFEKTYPCVLLLHGFKGYKDEATYVSLASELSKTGIASVRFDASGFADSEGTIKEDYRFGNYVDDVESVYKWIVRQDYVDVKKIGVCG